MKSWPGYEKLILETDSRWTIPSDLYDRVSEIVSGCNKFGAREAPNEQWNFEYSKILAIATNVVGVMEPLLV